MGRFDGSRQIVSAAGRPETNTISFVHRLTASESFKTLFKEGMLLVEEAAAYLDGPGREESRRLPRPLALAYASESMRLTTRLMQVASWLLLQRAVTASALASRASPAAPKSSTNCPPRCASSASSPCACRRGSRISTARWRSRATSSRRRDAARSPRNSSACKRPSLTEARRLRPRDGVARPHFWPHWLARPFPTEI
jgi:Protein of unknown function (DUF1465)